MDTSGGGSSLRSRLGLPPVGQGNRALFVSVVVDSVGAGMFLSLALLYFSQVHDVSPAVAGIAITLASLVSFLIVPVTGRIISRLGPRATLVMCNLATAAGYMAYAVGTSGERIFVAVLVVMTADRVYAAAWPSLVAQIYGRNGIARWFAATNAMKTMCLGLGAAAAGIALAGGGRQGLQVALLANAASSVIAAGLVWSTRTRSTASVPEKTIGFVSTLRDRKLMVLVASQILLSFVWIVPTMAFPVYLVESLGLPAYLPMVVVVCRYALIAVLQTPAVAWIEQWPRRQVLMVAIALAEIALGVTALCPILPLPWTVAAVIAVAVMLGTAELITKPTAAATAISLAPAGSEGSYMAVFQLTWTISYAVGPAVIGIGLAQPQLMWLGLAIVVLLSGATQRLSSRKTLYMDPVA